MVLVDSVHGVLLVVGRNLRGAYGEARLAKRLFWLDHEHEESSSEIATSRSNDFEVEMVAALVSHIVRQCEYNADDTAVLTPYLGQFAKIRRKLSSMFEIIVDERDAVELEAHGVADEGETVAPRLQRSSLANAVRIATVDNFQAEDAKLVLISLVRSNSDRKLGCLRTSKRINVLLSRVKHGMYLIGDSTCHETTEMWNQVIGMLRANDNIGSAISLCCPRHPQTPARASDPDDFIRNAPEGDCNEECAERLPCGHICPKKCHAKPLHGTVFCQIECARPGKGCEHLCSKACEADCGLCEVPIENVLLPCGHLSLVEKCHVNKFPDQAYCKFEAMKTVSGCAHEAMVACSQSLDNYTCQAACGTELPCGHKCKRRCHQCTNIEEGIVTSITTTNAKFSAANHI